MKEEIKYNKDEKWVSYKQLAETPQQTIARLEQENNSNLKQIELDVEHICRLNEQIDKLEQENKELKDKLNGYTNSYGELYSTANTLAFEHAKYKSALEEIRKECKCYGRQKGSNREFDREYGGELHINIIEQINEVLNHSEG